MAFDLDDVVGIDLSRGRVATGRLDVVHHLVQLAPRPPGHVNHGTSTGEGTRDCAAHRSASAVDDRSFSFKQHAVETARHVDGR